MKAFMIVLTVVMTVSTVQAQDTLKINSFRLVNTCSDEKSWLITLNLGRINFSDSLESFDIAIGYDRNILRPTSVLKEGTLSAQVSNGPVMNTFVEGEMRIYGFNIARSIAGDLPLFAVSGDFLGSCKDIGRFSVPFPPDFNGEFKRRFLIYQLDSVIAVSSSRVDNKQGCQFSVDTDTIPERNSELQLDLYLKNLSPLDTSEKSLEVSMVDYRDSANLVFKSVQCVGCIDKDQVITASDVRTTVAGPYSDSSRIRIVVSKKNSGKSDVVKLQAKMLNMDSCSCTRPGLMDSVEIFVQQPNVNVKSSLDDVACTIDIRNDFIRGMCRHTQMKALSVFDLHGQLIQQVKGFDEGIMISSDSFSSGMYFVVHTCSTVQTQKLILK